MQEGRKKLNQAGMSLLELVVVILIIGILAVGSAVGINYAGRMNATGAAEKLSSMLERTRLYTISADDTVKLVLSKEGDHYYGKIMKGSAEVDKVSLGSQALTVTIKEEGQADITVATGDEYEFSYKKENGAFTDTCTYSSVVITGASKTKTVQLVHATGRCYLK